jgi:N-formylmaleamate deformylase
MKTSRARQRTTARAYGWEEGEILVDGVRVHYTRTGGSKPPVVLAHGALDDGLCWTRIALALQADYDVVMPDSRGHGRSDHGNGDYSSEARARDLSGVIRALGLERPVVGGHSMGADTALHLAATYPELIRGVFLEDPPMPTEGEPIFGGKAGERMGESPKLLIRAQQVFALLPRFAVRAIARKLMPLVGADEHEPWIESKRRVSKDFTTALSGGLDVFRDPFTALARVQVPTMLIRGDRERGAIVGDAAETEARKTLPSIEVVHIAGANHDIRRSGYESYIAAVDDFLARTLVHGT